MASIGTQEIMQIDGIDGLGNDFDAVRLATCEDITAQQITRHELCSSLPHRFKAAQLKGESIGHLLTTRLILTALSGQQKAGLEIG